MNEAPVLLLLSGCVLFGFVYVRNPGTSPRISSSSVTTTSPLNPTLGSPALPSTPLGQELRDLHAAGSVSSHASGVRTWELRCYKCETWITTSISSTRILEEPGHFHGLEQHMRGKRYTPALVKQRSYLYSSHPSFSASSLTAPPPSFSPAPSSANLLTWSPQTRSADIRFTSESSDVFCDCSPPRLSRTRSELCQDESSMDVDQPGIFLSISRYMSAERLSQHGPGCAESRQLLIRGTVKNDITQITCDAKKGMNYKFLSHDQIQELLVERYEELNKIKLQSLNMGHCLGTFARKMDDFECLLMAIATKDVLRIHFVIETALRNSESIRAIINRIYAFEGLRQTKVFTDFEVLQKADRMPKIMLKCNTKGVA
ncbi:hypothetical protein K438DRAFT_1752543 [Mycena galopus ATCC 62051]|nr:hypothetical protein K438DRAFT_1752543 [Mycena galopus ATCC 62051]